MQKKLPSVKTLYPPLSTEFTKHRSSGGTLRHALHHYHNKEMKLLNLSYFPRVQIEATTVECLCPYATSGLNFLYQVENSNPTICVLK